MSILSVLGFSYILAIFIHILGYRRGIYTKDEAIVFCGIIMLPFVNIVFTLITLAMLTDKDL